MNETSSNADKAKALGKNVIILAMGNFLPKFVNLVTLPIITGYLTKIEYGTYDLISVLASLILPIATLEIETAAFRFLIPERGNREKATQIISTLICFISFTSFVAIFITYFFLSSLECRLLICIFLVINIFKSSLQQIARGLGENSIYSINSVVNAVINMVVIYVLVKLLGMGIEGATYGLIAASSFSCLFIILFGKIYKYFNPAKFSKKLLKEMLFFSWPMIPNDFSSWVMYVSDRFVLTAFWGLETTAVYAAANKIPNLMAAVLSTFNNAWHENASIYAEEKNIGEYYSKLFDLLLSFLCGALTVLVSLSPIFFELLIKGDYREAFPQMLVLFISSFFSAIAAFMAGIFIARKETKHIGITTMIAAGSNIIIDLALVKGICLWAASISTLISYMFLAILRLVYAINIWKMKINYVKICLYVIYIVLICIMAKCDSLLIRIINISVTVIIAVILNRQFITILFKKMLNKN